MGISASAGAWTSTPCSWRRTSRWARAGRSGATTIRFPICRPEIGQVGKSIDARERETTYTYDEQGRQTRVTYVDGLFEETEYDDEGRRVASIDRAGRRTEYDYDVLGRLALTTYANGDLSGTTEYDAAGRVTASIDVRGNRTEFAYDNAGRRLSVTDALGHVSSYTYDATGQQLTMTDALNRVTTNVYDTLGRRTKVIFADLSEKTTEYDALGRRTAEIDEEGKRTEYNYDDLGRLTSVKDALDHVTSYQYDELGQQTAQIDALGRITRYEYDKLGRRTRRILPEGEVEYLTYTVVGNLQTKEDFNGRTTYFEYDELDRLTSKIPDPVAFPFDPGVQWTYTETGQRESMSDSSGITLYDYDLLDRLQVKQTPQGTLTYGYDVEGNLSNITSSNINGTAVIYEYDELNRLKSANSNSLGDTKYSYTEVGALKSVLYPNAVKHGYQYDSVNRLLNTRVSNGSNAVLNEYSFILRPTGHRSQVTESSGRIVSWQYDDLYRLTNEAITGATTINGTSTWSFDAVGNRLTQASTIPGVSSQNLGYSSNDLLNNHSYDANGNTTVADGATYEWDCDNRLTKKTEGSDQVQMIYNGDGQLVRKVVGTETTDYLIDELNHTGYSQVLEELTNGTVTRVYTYGLDLISQERDENGDGQFTVGFYLYDGFMTVRGLSDLAGQVTDTFTFDAWGVLIGRTGTSLNAYLYRGERYEQEMGLYYNRARYLGVQYGRFWSMDDFEGQIKNPGGLHKYIYVENCPQGMVDPSGYAGISLTETSITAGISTLLSGFAYVSLDYYLNGGKGTLAAIEVLVAVIQAGGDLLSTFGSNVMQFLKTEIVPALTRVMSLLRLTANTLKYWASRTFFVIKTLMPTIYRFNCRELAANPAWHMLFYNGVGSAVTDSNRRWVDMTYGHLRWGAPPGHSLDEFPFASTALGGIAGPAKAQMVPTKENSRQGGYLGGVYRRGLRGVPGPFLVVPVDI